MNKKRLFAILILFQITLLTLEPFVVHAGLFGSGNVSGKARAGINSFLESDLNINVEDGLKPLTEMINSMDRKGKAPDTAHLNK